MKSDNEKFNNALDKISNVLAALLIQRGGEAKMKDKVGTLKGCGFSNAEIAGILGSTAASVQVILSSTKRAKRKGKTNGR